MKMSEYPKLFDHPLLKVEKKDYIATLTLTCPENQNKINEQFVDEFHKAMLDLRYDDEVRVIIVKAEGETFFGSGDAEKLIFSRMAQSELLARQFMNLCLAAVREMKDCGKPVIGCMDAPSVGGGCGYTLACDILFGTQKAGFNVGIHAVCGLVPDCGGVYALSRLVGPQKATWYSLRPEPVSADEAYKDGLISKLFDDADSMYEEAQKLAAWIAGLPPYGVQGIKNIAQHCGDMSFETYALFEAESVANGVHTKDFAVFGESMMKQDPSLRVYKGY